MNASTTVALRSRDFSIPGMSAMLSDDRMGPITVGPNGYLARTFVPGENLELTLELTAETGMFFLGVHIHETSNQVSEMPMEMTAGGGLVYRQTVVMRQDRESIVYVDRHSGNVRLIGVSPKGGCAMWNAAIVSQGGSMYLVFQKMFLVQAFRKDDGTVVLPELRAVKKWRQIEPFLAEKLADPSIKGLELSPAGEYAPEPERRFVDGQVKWYSLRQQMGCIFTPKGDARVPWHSIQTLREDRLKYVLEGEIVTYFLRAPRRRPGSPETNFRWEADQVRVVEST